MRPREKFQVSERERHAAWILVYHKQKLFLCYCEKNISRKNAQLLL